MLRLALALICLVCAPVAARAQCPPDTSVEAFALKLSAAETAFSALDAETFGERMDEAAFTVPCVSEPITPQLAARYHRMIGLRWYGTGNGAQASRAFAAARAAVPGYSLPTSLVPDGHAARDTWALLPVEGAGKVPVPRPVRGHLLFDGVIGDVRPAEWPAWVQVLDGDDQVVASAYLLPADPMPAYEGRPLRPDGRRRMSAGRRAAGIGSLATTGLALGLYGLAAASAADFEKNHPDWDFAALAAQRQRTNTLVTASVATGGVALAGGVVFLVIR